MGDTPGTDEIREILARRVDQQKQAVGIVAGVIDSRGRRVVAHGRFGASDPRPLDGETIFEIGSITKVFTSLLLADMARREEVALEDPASKYLPANVTMPACGGKPITLRDLATHTSGLPRIPPGFLPKDPRNPYAGYTVDDLYRFLSTYTLPRDPGAEVEYSNWGAGLLGHLLARRAGMDYASLIEARITRPLGMPDTAIALSPSMQQRMAAGHNSALEPVPNCDLPALAGAGALRSSVHDMLTFLEAFLGYCETPLTPAMNSMVAVRRPVGATKFEIGLGWSILGDIVLHDGGTGGFCSFAAYDPNQRTGVVLLSNTFVPAGVADIGMHLLNPKSPLLEPEAGKHAAPVDPKLFDRYLGRYQLPDRIFEITREGDRLFAQALTPTIAGPKFEMFAESETKFLVKLTGSHIHFEIGAEDQATSLTMLRPGRDPITAPRLSLP